MYSAKLLNDGTTTLSKSNKFHAAAVNGQIDILRSLILKKCDINSRDKLGFTALQLTCAQGHLECVSLLLQNGAFTNNQDNMHGNTALHEAAWNGFSRTLTELIKFGADVNLVNKSKFSALHLSSQNGHNESSRILLYAGARQDFQNNYGDSALHTAARYGHAGVTRILLSAHANVNLQNLNGDTALHISIALNKKKIVSMLLNSKINARIMNNQNESAMDIAIRKGYIDIINLLNSQNNVIPEKQVPGFISDNGYNERVVLSETNVDNKKSKWFGFLKRNKAPKDQTRIPNSASGQFYSSNINASPSHYSHQTHIITTQNNPTQCPISQTRFDPVFYNSMRLNNTDSNCTHMQPNLLRTHFDLRNRENNISYSQRDNCLNNIRKDLHNMQPNIGNKPLNCMCMDNIRADNIGPGRYTAVQSPVCTRAYRGGVGTLELPEMTMRNFHLQQMEKYHDQFKLLSTINRPQQSVKTNQQYGIDGQYMPYSGVQYYCDLAGNIKKGPIGYAPAQHIEINNDFAIQPMCADSTLSRHDHLVYLRNRENKVVAGDEIILRSRSDETLSAASSRINRHANNENVTTHFCTIESTASSESGICDLEGLNLSPITADKNKPGNYSAKNSPQITKLDNTKLENIKDVILLENGEEKTDSGCGHGSVKEGE